MARGAGARRKRQVKRRAMRRVEQPGVEKAPVLDTVVAAVEGREQRPVDEVIVEMDVPWFQQKLAERIAVAALGEDPDPALVALTRFQIAEEYADAEIEAVAADMLADEFARAACANCDHAYAAHLGDVGPCSMDGCSCKGYAAEEAAAAVETATPSPESFGTVTAYFTMKPSSDGVVTIEPSSAGTEGSFALTFDLPTPAVEGVEIADPQNGGDIEWSAVIAPEGKLTSDGRAFAPGAISWRELPLTLMAMTETSEGGHIGAEVAGRIDKIWRDEAAGLIRAHGVFDTGEYGQKIARLVADQTLRGVSVDLAISQYEQGPKSDWFDEDGNWAPKDPETRAEPDLIDLLYAEEPPIAVVYAAEIGMTTVCPFPAFAEAKIAIGESLVAAGVPTLWTVTAQAGFTVVATVPPVDVEDCGCDVVTASAAGLTPTAPPASYFSDPSLDEPTPLTVDENGRVFGHAALWGTCHIGIQGRCQTAPHSITDYAFFHLGEVLCDDGSRQQVGTITLDTGHAAQGLNAQAATRHYDDTGTAVVYARVGEDEHGIWVAGAVRSDVDAEAVATLRGGKLSGDWRKIEGNLELVALLTVNVPGFPVPAPRQLVAGGEVVSLTAAGIPIFEADLDPVDLEKFRALGAHVEFAALAGQAA